MGPSTSSDGGYIDGNHHSLPWSPPMRPTVNTSFSNSAFSTSSDPSSHPSSLPPISSLPPSSIDSPWSSNPPASSPNQVHDGLHMLSHSSSYGDELDQLHHPVSNDWNNIFSSPLNPSVFAVLAANGVLGSAQGPSDISPSSFRSSQYTSTHPRSQSNMNGMNQHGHSHGQTSSWSQSPSPYLSDTSYVPKPAVPRHSSITSIPHGKGKSSIEGISHYPHIQPRPLDAGEPYISKPIDERGSDQRHRPQGSVNSKSSGHSRNVGSRANYRNSGPFNTHAAIPQSTVDYHLGYSFAGDRSSAGLPPSLWMSPASPPPAPVLYSPPNPPSLSMSPTIVGDSSSHSSSYGHSPLSPNHSSAADSKSTFFSDIFSEDLFDNQGVPFSDQDTSYTSQRLSGSPDLKAAEFVEADDPETLAREDPLATQVWKMYARNKAALPHAHRMENLTWRMMSLALKKRKDEEAKAPDQAVEQSGSFVSTKEESPLSKGLPSSPQTSTPEGHNTRGRGRDKGQVRVVGFDGTNQDGAEDDEYVILNYCVRWRHA